MAELTSTDEALAFESAHGTLAMLGLPLFEMARAYGNTQARASRVYRDYGMLSRESQEYLLQKYEVEPIETELTGEALQAQLASELDSRISFAPYEALFHEQGKLLGWVLSKGAAPVGELVSLALGVLDGWLMSKGEFEMLPYETVYELAYEVQPVSQPHVSWRGVAACLLAVSYSMEHGRGLECLVDERGAVKPLYIDEWGDDVVTAEDLYFAALLETHIAFGKVEATV